MWYFCLLFGLIGLIKLTLIKEWIYFPVVMSMSFALHFLLLMNGMGLTIATYIPLIIVGLTLTILERCYPHRENWSASFKDWIDEGIYIGLVQIVFQKCLLLFFVITILQQLRAYGFDTVLSSWPTHVPIIFQVITMLVLAEFMHYWLHRLAHQNKFLWRFHAVHHSVKKLHWLNVGRFHLVEKGLQFILEAAPFLLLGVPEHVIVLCYLFYATIGFFQHSNINIKLGFLNYIFSGPELHRWHHSLKISESNNNYGTNLIIWDLIFGTWYLPKNRDVETLGLLNKNYPMSFIKQLKAPFMKDVQT